MYDKDVCSSGPAREPIASEIMKYANRLAERSENLSARLSDRLSPVTSIAPPSVACNGKESVQDYPPLFADLRRSFRNIEAALDAINDTMDRTEL